MGKLEPFCTSSERLLVIINEIEKVSDTKGNWQDLDVLCQHLSKIKKSKKNNSIIW